MNSIELCRCVRHLAGAGLLESEREHDFHRTSSVWVALGKARVARTRACARIPSNFVGVRGAGVDWGCFGVHSGELKRVVRIGTTLGTHWRRIGDALGVIGDALWARWERIGGALGAHSVRIGSALGANWERIGAHGVYWGRIGDALWTHWERIWAERWGICNRASANTPKLSFRCTLLRCVETVLQITDLQII